MRRGLILLAGMGMLGLVLGCKMHGVCDCDMAPAGPADHPARALHAGAEPAPVSVISAPGHGSHGEAIPAMPRSGH